MGVVAETQREELQGDRAERSKHWLRPIGALALRTDMMLGGVAPAVGAVDLTGSPVALHASSRANPNGEPNVKIDHLEPLVYGEVADDLVEDDLTAGGDSLDTVGVLDEGEDLNGNGVLDAGINEDGDGTLGDDRSGAMAYLFQNLRALRGYPEAGAAPPP